MTFERMKMKSITLRLVLKCTFILYFFLLTSVVYSAHAEDVVSIAASPVATLQVDDVEIGYRIFGNGDPLLLITGYGITMEGWDSLLISSLAEKYKVIIFDNRGMGYSSASQQEFTLSLFAGDAAAVLKALNISSAHVIGWSMGALVALEMARSNPEAVRKLILYAPCVDKRHLLDVVQRMTAMTGQELAQNLFPQAWVQQHPDIFSRLPLQTVPPTADIVSRQRQAMAQWAGPGDMLQKLRVPTLLVVGQDDWVTPPQCSIDIAAQVPGAWLARFNGAGHWLMYQAPKELAGVVGNFLETEENLLHKQ